MFTTGEEMNEKTILFVRQCKSIDHGDKSNQKIAKELRKLCHLYEGIASQEDIVHYLERATIHELAHEVNDISCIFEENEQNSQILFS